MLNLVYFIIFGFSALMIPQNFQMKDDSHAKFLDEQLTFKMEYLKLDVALLSFHLFDTTEINNQKAYHLIVKANSTRTAGMLFMLNNVYQTFFNEKNFLPIKSVKKIRQKNINHDLTIDFNHQKQQALIGDSISWSIPADCYDYFSMLYYLRSKHFSKGDIIHFHLDSEHLISRVEAIFLPGQEILKIPAGKFNSIQVRLMLQPLNDEPRPWKTDLLTNRLAAPGSELTIWLSNDKYRLPLKISYQQSMVKTHLLLKSFRRGKQD